MKLHEAKKELMKSARFRKAYTTPDLAYMISRMLIEARIKNGFTQKQLADAIGTTQSSIARAEQGTHVVSLDFLQKIASAYKTDLVPPRFQTTRKRITARLRHETLVKPDLRRKALITS